MVHHAKLLNLCQEVLKFFSIVMLKASSGCLQLDSVKEWEPLDLFEDQWSVPSNRHTGMPGFSCTLALVCSLGWLAHHMAPEAWHTSLSRMQTRSRPSSGTCHCMS